MEELIKKVNKLQDAFSTVGVSNPVDLPQIVVIGSQSSGKSSVLENIVGKDFLPRGSGIVTRRPLVLQLINKSSGYSPASTPKSPTNKPPSTATDEWGEFLHLPGQKFYDFHKIREEIVRDTEKVTGKNAGISPIPIGLRVFSPNVLTLTLVDLPGLTKVPVGDQPADIERQIREMIVKYISKPNAIILAVTAANTDLANSDGLKLAREVDPEGIRSIGVLTKIDLMDEGTDVVDILAGRIIPLRLGYVPVVNRGQRDIEKGKEINLALDAERQFFENHPSYKSKAQYCGTPFLARKLNLILMHHIRNTLPEIKAKISAGLEKYQDELIKLGDPIVEGHQGNTILQIITEFCNEFRSVLEGSANDLSSSELSGGARISFVFHELFANGIRTLDPFDQVKDVDIRTILYNSSGSAPSLFVGTAAFEVIVKQQIKRLEDPSLRCVSMTYDELVRILTQVLNSKPAFKRFPALKEKFYSVVNSFFKRALEPTNLMVKNIISAESCYINTGHPDFITGHRAMAMINERMNPPKPAQPMNTPPTGRRDQMNPIMSTQPSMNNLTISGGEKQDSTFFESFFQGGKKSGPKKPPMMEAPPAQLKASGTLSEREFMETEVIKLLLQSYFNIVKRTVADLVPKSIMYHLVTTAKQDLQKELLRELYGKGDILEETMKESPITQERRAECKRMLEALAKADEIVAGV